MPSAPADIEAAEDLVPDPPKPEDVARRSFLKGLAILLPLVITLLVLSLVFSFISNAIDPFVAALKTTPLLEGERDSIVRLLTIVLFFTLVFSIGFVAEFGSNRNRLAEQLDVFMTSIPGIGSMYSGFNEMSELLLDSDTDSFQDVKLVEYPGEDSYVVAFKTTETAESIAKATGNDDMVTLFMPMAPNPVMGGFVIHVSRDRVVDVDLTVEEGIRSIVTSGVAVGEAPDDRTGHPVVRAASSEIEGDEGTGANESVDNDSTSTVDDEPRND